MSRKSQETIGPNVDIPATTEFNAFRQERFECEMTGIKNVNFSVPHVLSIALRFAEIERQIVLTPDDPAIVAASPASTLPLRM